MRKINRIVIHCSAARPKGAETQTAKDIDAMHRRDRGWKKIGYHYFIRHNGAVEKGRAEDEVGAGVFGFNPNSIHICYAGGLDADGKPADTRTLYQKASMVRVVLGLVHKYKGAKVMGHRDLSPDKDGDGKVEEHEWLKECPCFSVEDWMIEVGI